MSSSKDLVPTREFVGAWFVTLSFFITAGFSFLSWWSPYFTFGIGARALAYATIYAFAFVLPFLIREPHSCHSVLCILGPSWICLLATGGVHIALAGLTDEIVLAMLVFLVAVIALGIAGATVNNEENRRQRIKKALGGHYAEY